MVYILIGVFAFLIAYAYDWLNLKRVGVIKQLVGLLAACLLFYATVMVCISPAKFHLPPFALPIGGCLLLISLSLLAYSLFIEIPFRKTYTNREIGNELTTTGTYALVRHPGVIWLGLVFLSLALLFPSTTLFIAVTTWLVMDIIYVILQERLFFPKMFPDYLDYQRRTPFLVPNKQSFSACLKTIKPRTKARN